MVYALESSDARHWAPQEFSRVVSFDFSNLRNAHGSVYDAAQKVAQCAEVLSASAKVLVYKQFVVLSGGPRTEDLVDSLARSCDLSPSDVSVAAIPSELRRFRGSAAVWWAVFMWARATRASGGQSSWADVSRDLGAVVGTPPPLAPTALRSQRKLTFPADLVSRYFDEASSTHIALVQDFVGYNKRTTWGGEVVGVGVTDELSREVMESRSFANLTEAAFQRLFAARRRLQLQIDQFEIDLRRELRAIPGAAFIPGGADGSLGNDGVLVALPEGGDPSDHALVARIARRAKFAPVTLTLLDSTRPILAASERCLAAMKASLHVDRRSSVQMISPCGLCRSAALAGAPSGEYLAKQSIIYSTCNGDV